MKETETLIVESLKSFFDSKAKLGLPADAPKDGGPNDPRLLGIQYLNGQIDELFTHKATELVHFTGVCASFDKIHQRLHLTDSRFHRAMDSEMSAQGIPESERKKALGFIPKIIEELKDERESNFGFHPNLQEIIDISQPPQYET